MDFKGGSMANPIEEGGTPTVKGFWSLIKWLFGGSNDSTPPETPSPDTAGEGKSDPVQKGA
jgi:hypothetical protein